MRSGKVWSSQRRRSRRLIANYFRPPQILVDQQSFRTVRSSFDILYFKEVISFFQNIQHSRFCKKSLNRYWAIVLIMMMSKVNDLKDYWSTHELGSNKWIPQIMARDPWLDVHRKWSFTWRKNRSRTYESLQSTLFRDLSSIIKSFSR